MWQDTFFLLLMQYLRNIERALFRSHGLTHHKDDAELFKLIFAQIISSQNLICHLACRVKSVIFIFKIHWRNLRYEIQL